MTLEQFVSSCYVTEQYGSLVVVADIHLLVDLLKTQLGKDNPATIKWMSEQERIKQHREKSHREAVAWDEWRDSIANRM